VNTHPLHEEHGQAVIEFVQCLSRIRHFRTIFMNREVLQIKDTPFCCCLVTKQNGLLLPLDITSSDNFCMDLLLKLLQVYLPMFNCAQPCLANCRFLLRSIFCFLARSNHSLFPRRGSSFELISRLMQALSFTLGNVENPSPIT